VKTQIACYLRVSTDEQKTDLQQDSIINYCKMKGINTDSLYWYIDKGESGSKTSRPQFDQMMKDIRTGHYSALITWKFDRIGRSTVHLITVLEELKTLEIDFISITESVDTSSPMGKMIFGIFAVLAQFEREQLIMRTKAGMNAAKERGAKIGRTKKLDMDQELEIVDELNKGAKIEEVINQFNISRATVYRIKNQLKVGA
jgi:DNA invertase Pin-like site-specific DNA recombinase